MTCLSIVMVLHYLYRAAVSALFSLIVLLITRVLCSKVTFYTVVWANKERQQEKEKKRFKGAWVEREWTAGKWQMEKREEGSFRCQRFLDLPLNPCLHLHGRLSFSADCSQPAREIRSLNWSIRGLCCYAESNVINQPLLCRWHTRTHPAAGCWYYFCILGRKQNNSRERKCAENYIILHNKYIFFKLQSAFW